MASTELVIVEGNHILKNLTVINRNMNMIIGNVLDPHVKKYMRGYMQTKLKPYPPKPPNSTYVRTGELGRSWDVFSNKTALEVGITNTKEYAPGVVGKEQAGFHKITGWPFLPSHEKLVVRDAKPIVTRSFDSELRHFLFKRGLL